MLTNCIILANSGIGTLRPLGFSLCPLQIVYVTLNTINGVAVHHVILANHMFPMRLVLFHAWCCKAHGWVGACQNGGGSTTVELHTCDI